ncbi:paraquat-inducible protein B [Alcanivorax hongdengensis A-11-3]|uniref:Paraquat-inducible protein B n=1 Tax=Alcanivorax hongdengensis A-11-3 TaxID=1177179 RepID=L0WF46_9GAMM|nr:paraquat-inducible protein B [Alcanivorax hongdengensis A-11-3]
MWLIPLAALLLGLWLLMRYVSSQGPTVTLVMDDAEGINAGKTAIKTRNVQVGMVEGVELSQDLAHTLVTVQMQADSERMLGEKARFWVVKPRIGREGISGLGTVLSGAYIELLPDQSGKPRRRFTVENTPPVTEAGSDGLYLNLDSEPGNNVSTGDPVLYHNLVVGRIVDRQFNVSERRFALRILIKAPYDVLVTDHSRFWSTSGVDLQLNAEGLKVQAPSLEAVLGGGIAFADLDTGNELAMPAEKNQHFTLYANREQARRGLYQQHLDYVLLVPGSVRGLSAGAPVEYRGVRVGTVEQVPWQFIRSNPASLGRDPIPVLIRIEPQRLGGQQSISEALWRQGIDKQFKQGLRASLRSGNLLTGGRYVDLDFHDHSDRQSWPASYHQVPVFPTVNGGFSQLENQLGQLLKKLNQLPMQDIAHNLNASLANLSALTSQLQQVLDDPALQQLPQQMADNLEALHRTLDGLQPGSPGYGNLQETLKQLDTTLRDVQPLLRTLREHPNALIFSPNPPADPQPRAPRHD